MVMIIGNHGLAHVDNTCARCGGVVENDGYIAGGTIGPVGIIGGQYYHRACYSAVSKQDLMDQVRPLFPWASAAPLNAKR